jgi:hypothetical protein
VPASAAASASARLSIRSVILPDPFPAPPISRRCGSVHLDSWQPRT